MDSKQKRSLIAPSVTLALGISNAEATLVQNVFGTYNWSTDSANFTMLNGAGNTIGPDGGTNDLSMSWDGNAYSASSDYTGVGSPGNVTASTTDTFFGYVWTAHDIQVFVPGSYSFDTALGGGNGEAGILNVTVPTGQLGMHMLFDWNGSLNFDVFAVLAQSAVFGAGIGRSTQNTAYGNLCDGTTTTSVTNCLFDGKPWDTAGKPAGNQTWMLATVDGDGDGVMGIPMALGGAFQNFNATFNANLTPTPDAIPIPAAAWLFGSGLLGMAGVGRHRKRN